VRYAFFGLSNWVLQNNTDFYFAPRAEFNPYTHTWSLGVEEQFYLIVPILLFYWAAHQHSARTIIKNSAVGILGLLCIVSLAILIWASKHQPAMAFYFIGARFWELGIGAILFLQTQKGSVLSASASAFPPISSWRKTVHSILSSSLLPYVGIMGLAIAFVFTNPNAFPWPWAILTVASTLILIGGAQASTTHGVRRILGTALLVWIGRRSYSLYLWHWPIYVLLRWTIGLESVLSQAVALLLAFGLAALSYRLIEQPFRQSTWLKARTNIFQIAVFALLTVGGFYTVNWIFSHASKISLSKVTNTPSDWYRTSLQIYPEVAPAACQIQTSVIDFQGGKIVRSIPTKCTIPNNQHAIYVLGDSHAGMLAPALTQIGAAQAKAVDIYTFPGCSYINFQAPMHGQFSKECLAFNEAARDHIANSAKAGDLVVLSSLRLMRYGDQWTYFNYPDMYDKMYGPATQAQHQAALVDAQQWLLPFTQHQLLVLFTAPTPIFKAPTFRCSDWFNRSNPICIGHNEQDRSELERLRAPIVQAMTQLAKGNPFIYLWDPFPILCPENTCTTYRGERPLFFDGDHLSNYGNLAIYPSLSKTIEQIQNGAGARAH
jgi:peptidoglycan/LPS O-acetylase OafA/YrhL